MNLRRLIKTQVTSWVMLSAFALPVLQMSVPANAFSVENLAPATAVETQTFEIKINNENIASFLSVAQASEPEVVIEEVDPLQERKQLLREYLEARNSRFAPYADALAEQPEWRKILTISFAESTMGQRCYREYNCWGITYSSGLAIYPDFETAFADVNRILSKPLYQGKSYEQMCGIYVQPCTNNWLRANYQIAEQIAHIQ